MIRLLVAIVFLAIFSVGYAQQEISVEEVILTSLQQNYDIRLRQNDAVPAFYEDRLSFGTLLPRLNAQGATVSNNNNNRTITASNVETIRKGVQSDNINGSVQLAWTLFDGTKMFATRKRLGETAELAELAIKDQVNNTVAEVINTYFSIVREKQQLKAFAEQIGVSEERVKLAEKKLQVGTGGKPEFLQAKIDLNAFRTASLQQEARILQLKEQLNLLVGMGLPDQYDISDSIPIQLDLHIEEIEQNFENTNRTLLAAKKSIDIANASLWETKALQSPVFNFTSSYNFSKTENAVATSAVSLLYTRVKGYNYGLNLSMPIFNGFSTRTLIQRAQTGVSRQQLIYDQQKAAAAVGIRNAFINYENARQTLIIEEENILLAKENVFIALEGFKRGITTFIELRTAQQSLQEAYNRLIAVRYRAKVAETELLRLQGVLVK
jgi:outer membrane protein